MIDATSDDLYTASLAVLRGHKRAAGAQFKGRFTQLFLALKFYQQTLPSMFSNSFVSTEVLQTLLDNLFAKASRPLNQSVLMLFDGSYLARTGLTGPGNATPQNTWRNNLNLQKGIGCFAPPADLSSATFLNQSRAQCRFLEAVEPGLLRGANCSLATTNARYRNEDHRKWLRIDPNGNGYAATDTLNTANFIPYVSPGGATIPILPLIVALYHDGDPGLLVGQRPSVGTAEFRSDFGFSDEEMGAYFGTQQTDEGNRVLIEQFPALRGELLLDEPTRAPRHRAHNNQLAEPRVPRAPTLPAPGTLVTPPVINTGFDAEQFVAKALEDDGWTVHNVSRQQLGYDLLIKRGLTTRYIEVKSSVGVCSPSMTSREWTVAKANADSYVLAVIEKFVTTGPNTIFWIPDPATCPFVESRTVSYAIARSSWILAAVPLANI